MQLWEAISGKCVASLVGHKEEVLDVCFDLSGRFVTTASADGKTLKLKENETRIVTLSQARGLLRMHIFIFHSHTSSDVSAL